MWDEKGAPAFLFAFCGIWGWSEVISACQSFEQPSGWQMTGMCVRDWLENPQPKIPRGFKSPIT